MVWTAVIKPSNDLTKGRPTQQTSPLTASNVRNEVIIPLISSATEYNPDVPYFDGLTNFPQFDKYMDESPPFRRQPPPPPTPPPQAHDDPRYRQLSNDESDDYYDGGGGGGGGGGGDGGGGGGGSPQETPTKKPKKIYKAIERVYFYPQDDSNHEPTKNKNAMNLMKRQLKNGMPEKEYPFLEEPERDDEDYQSEYDPRKDYRQMDDNPPRQEHEDPDPDFQQNAPESEDPELQSSIAEDAQQFNGVKEFETDDTAVDKDDPEGDTLTKNMDNTNFGERIDPNPTYRESLAHTLQDSDNSPNDGDYGNIHNFPDSDEYEVEKKMYENPNSQQPVRGGHRYHKDRRRPRRKPVVEPYEQRDHEVSGLVDSEADERDYLSNYDVVKQMRNSENKYNTGVDPVYSSKKDFDEVQRLEKMIEKVALLNKQKEKTASADHDNSSRNEGEASETNVSKIKPNNDKDNKHRDEE
ncbi:uncharacterized protein LOC128962695 [Oppia nitens]|uniref:uncharacterized protein LOC128962695 n=1 Tax=Oppia nitens TaxID=1686743 RepID=UPI0023DBF548|nr:uncharacterized protein LOC128962695 [Oppia nitens]